MSQEEELRFTQLVARQLPSDDEAVRSLWTPLADEYERDEPERDGPESVKNYLDTELQRFEVHINDLLERLETE